MRQVIANGQTFNLKYASQARERFGGTLRSVLTLTLEGTDYGAVKSAFTGLTSLVIKDGDAEYDHSGYTLPGEIADLMDGKYRVKLGASLTAEEELRQSLNEARGLISTVAGKSVASAEEAEQLRGQIEQMYVAADVSDTQKIELLYLCPEWTPGNHRTGEVYKTFAQSVRQIWECIQDYDNATYPDLIPTDPSWYTFHRPFHGTTPETAMDYVKPLGAHDQYKSGEYMRYTDGLIYKCLSDTSFSPEEYAEAWEQIAE